MGLLTQALEFVTAFSPNKIMQLIGGGIDATAFALAIREFMRQQPGHVFQAQDPVVRMAAQIADEQKRLKQLIVRDYQPFKDHIASLPRDRQQVWTQVLNRSIQREYQKYGVLPPRAKPQPPRPPVLSRPRRPGVQNIRV
jgi:hypothetical protein